MEGTTKEAVREALIREALKDSKYSNNTALIQKMAQYFSLCESNEAIQHSNRLMKEGKKDIEVFKKAISETLRIMDELGLAELMEELMDGNVCVCNCKTR